MIELTVAGTRVRLHPLALLLPPLGWALGLRDAVPALILSLMVHEAGHLAAARLCRVRVTALTVMPFGCGLRLGNLYALSPGQAFAVSAGGPAASLLMLFIDGALAHWGLLSPAAALGLLRVTLMLLLFNLLPALPLDGGRMLYALTARRLGRDRAVKLCSALGYVVAVALLACTVWMGIRTHRLNLTLPACALFMLMGIAEDRRALTDAIPESLLNALKTSDAPVPMRLCAISGDIPIHRALRHSAPDAATLYAVYEGDALTSLTDERALLSAAIQAPAARVIDAVKKRSRIA